MINNHVEVYPLRALWIVPIVLLSGFINDVILSTAFAFAMGFVTSKLFPVVVRKETK
jgi:hypothetical protein